MRPNENPLPRKVEVPKLTVTQIVASALAAVSATFAASFFGVAGTIIGAGLGSVVTVIGNAIYIRSIQRVRQAVPLRTVSPHRFDRTRPLDPHSGSGPAGRPPAPDSSPPPAPDGQPRSAADAGWPAAVATRRRLSIPWRQMGFAAAGLFLVVAAIVTGVELASGRPLTDIVRDKPGSGTSLFGRSPDSSSTPTPSASRTPPSTGSTSASPSETPPTSAAPPPSTPQSTPSLSGTPTTSPPTTPTSTAPTSPPVSTDGPPPGGLGASNTGVSPTASP